MTLKQALELMKQYDAASQQDGNTEAEELIEQTEEAVEIIAEATSIPDWFLAENCDYNFELQNGLESLTAQWREYNAILEEDGE